MPLSHLEEYLTLERISYKRIMHPRAYTAQKTAAYAHISGKDIAKTVMVKVDGRMCMTVLPAPCHVDLFALKQATAAKDVRLATEYEFKDVFKDCEVGAMPPFGNLYHMEVFVSDLLDGHHDIYFNGGSHAELIQMRYDDFRRLVQPVVLKMTHLVLEYDE